MTQNTVAAEMVRGTCGVLQVHLREFSDAQMFARPVPLANHAMWQVGHLIGSAVRMTALFGRPFTPPEWFAGKFTKDSSAFDDVGAFPSRADLMAGFDAVYAALADAIQQASPELLASESPETVRRMAPTLGHVAILACSHVSMHIGQIQVIRRSLGFPVLF
jgi:hypothetical protein